VEETSHRQTYWLSYHYRRKWNCDAGRIRHHLKRWLWNSGAVLWLVSRRKDAKGLEEGVKAVRIQGDEIKVAARIRRIDLDTGARRRP
jgi:Cft2 family RNA processing exonuclease